MQETVVVWCGVRASGVPWDKISAHERNWIREREIRAPGGRIIGYGTPFTRWPVTRASDRHLTPAKLLDCLLAGDRFRLVNARDHIVAEMVKRGIGPAGIQVQCVAMAFEEEQ